MGRDIDSYMHLFSFWYDITQKGIKCKHIVYNDDKKLINCPLKQKSHINYSSLIFCNVIGHQRLQWVYSNIFTMGMYKWMKHSKSRSCTTTKSCFSSMNKTSSPWTDSPQSGYLWKKKKNPLISNQDSPSGIGVWCVMENPHNSRPI